MVVRILGFDPGTANTGYSTIEGDLKQAPHLLDEWGVLNTSLDDGSVRERIDQLGNEMKLLIERVNPTHIAIEDFTEQGKLVGKTYKEMAWLTEHMRLVGREMGYEVVIFENGYWKKQTLGIARASKEQVQHFISRKVMGTEVLKSLPKSKNHIWDSVGIANCMYTLLKQGA